ncbi:MAG: hypothetical protein GX564_00425, partial [Oligosphaeraceae bacterium]|nr:hypothetical protein [Oligosphaeraceae bacterium]
MVTEFTHNSDLRITPQGQLRDDECLPGADTGSLLLALVQEQLSAGPPGRQYFHRLFSNYLRDIAALGEPEGGDLGGFFQQCRPAVSEAAFLALSAPPLMGMEYFNDDVLYAFYLRFECALQAAFAAAGGAFTDFIRSLSPAWRDVGKVAFHLAENKGDTSGKCPFAFMVSFVHRVEGDKAKHLPLAAALKASAGQAQRLEALLRPIQIAAEKSRLIRELLESRRIFQPVAWSSREAFEFLQDIPAFEAANIVIRIVNLWKKSPARAKVKVSLDVSGKGLFGAGALLDFSVSVSLGGETLTGAELAELLSSQGGLVRLKGQWVLAEPEKIAAMLAQWQEAERLSGQEGISLTDGLRLLAGAEQGYRSSVNPDESEVCTFEPSGELRQLLQELRHPAQIELPELPGN